MTPSVLSARANFNCDVIITSMSRFAQCPALPVPPLRGMAVGGCSTAETLPTQQTPNICITFIQSRTSVEDAGPTLYKCYTNALCLLGKHG